MGQLLYWLLEQCINSNTAKKTKHVAWIHKSNSATHMLNHSNGAWHQPGGSTLAENQ